MNAPLTHLPAYLGLWASLVLAVTCNAFLDIRFGIFGFEVIVWTAVFAWTTLVGYGQRGIADERGSGQQKIVLLVGGVLTVLIVIPVWGFPRAGVYILAILQAAMNCVTTTRRQLHFGLLVSVVMVMFAAAHHRADWTMLFYLVPYIVAVVFTLVSEQVSRRAEDIRAASLGSPAAAGQGLAIAAATILILALAGALYMATPQPNWLHLRSSWGQPTPPGLAGKPDDPGQAGQRPGSGQSGGQGGGMAGNGEPLEGGPGDLMPQWGWPGSAAMREAAGRPGMPAWQSGLIEQLADAGDWVGKTCSPLKREIEDLIERLREWLKEHRKEIAAALLALIAVALLAALALLLREVRAVTWLRTRLDYLRLVSFDAGAAGTDGAAQYYAAMERLFALRETPRRPTANAREFLAEATEFRPHLRPQATELTWLFERARYGDAPTGPQERRWLRDLYRALFRELG
ncbi:MAG: DUF4129 domain-containing protein [Betaproteobacteria bacterium]|nr:DUF4129 domain-containing protein [Betaproteobacteria bacterium]